MVFKIFRPFFPTIEKPASFYAPYIQEELDFAKEQSEQMKEGLKNAMIENGVNVWDAGRLRASVTPATTGKSFDTKAFQTDYPDLYSKYLKSVEKKASIRITIRKEKENECE